MTQYRPRPLSADELLELARDYTAGTTARELGKRYGLHEATVFSLLRKLGIATRLNRPRHVAATAEAIEEARRRLRGEDAS